MRIKSDKNKTGNGIRTGFNRSQTIQLPPIPLLQRGFDLIFKHQSLPIELPYRDLVFLISLFSGNTGLTVRRLVGCIGLKGLCNVRCDSVRALEEIGGSLSNGWAQSLILVWSCGWFWDLECLDS